MMTTDSRNWLILALVIFFGWLVWLLGPIITPFAVSMVLAFLGDPLVDRLEKAKVHKWQLGRTMAVVLVFILILSVLTAVVLVLVPMMIDQLQMLIRKMPEWFAWVSDTGWPWVAAKLGMDVNAFDQTRIAGILKEHWQEIGTVTFKVIDLASKGGMAMVVFVTNLVLIPVVTFYLLRDWDVLVSSMRSLLPRKMEGPIGKILGDMDDVLGAFFRGQLLVMIALGMIYALGLSVVGLEFALLIGLVAGLLSIVPYLGTTVGVVVASLAAIFQFHDWNHLLMVWAVFIIGQSAEGWYLTPKLVGDKIGLHPVTVIFAVLAGGQLFGFVGILLALPVAAALNVLLRDAHKGYLQSELYLKDHPKDDAAESTQAQG